MQILLALILGGALGFGAHLLLPDRDSRGTALAPVLGALSGAAAWMVLTWLGFAIDNPWLWLSAIVVPVAVVVPVVATLARTRTRHDAAERQRLRIG